MASYYQLLAIDYRERAVEALQNKDYDKSADMLILMQECKNLAHIAVKKLN